MTQAPSSKAKPDIVKNALEFAQWSARRLARAKDDRELREAKQAIRNANNYLQTIGDVDPRTREEIDAWKESERAIVRARAAKALKGLE